MMLLSIAVTRQRPQEAHEPNSVLLVLDWVLLNYTNTGDSSCDFSHPEACD